MNRTADKASIDVIRVVVQVGAVAPVADGIEYVGINAVLDAMHRAVGKHRVQAGRMRRSEEEVRVPIVLIREPGHVLITSGIDDNEISYLCLAAGAAAVGHKGAPQKTSCILCVPCIRTRVIVLGLGKL